MKTHITASQLSIKKILNMTPADYMALDDSSLKALARKVFNETNIRARKIGNAGLISTAYVHLTDSGVKTNVNAYIKDGKIQRAVLRSAVNQATAFLRAQGSRVKQARIETKRAQRIIGTGFTVSDFWRVYNKAIETRPILGMRQYGSSQTVRDVEKIFKENKNLTLDDIEKIVASKLDDWVQERSKNE